MVLEINVMKEILERPPFFGVEKSDETVPLGLTVR